MEAAHLLAERPLAGHCASVPLATFCLDHLIGSLALGTMSVAGLRFSAIEHYGSPLETKSGSYIYSGTAAAFHDWEFRTRARVLQHRERAKRELATAQKIRSQRWWVGSSRAQPAASWRNSASESVPASLSSARRQGTTRVLKLLSNLQMPTMRHRSPTPLQA